jgi:hypothetical protein
MLVAAPQTPATVNNNKGTLSFMTFMIVADLALGFSRPVAS